MPDITTLPEITDNLDHVHGGGGRGKAIAAGAKAAFDAVRPWVAKGAAAAETIGNYVGGAVAVKEAWDYFRGGGASPPQAPAKP